MAEIISEFDLRLLELLPLLVGRNFLPDDPLRLVQDLQSLLGGLPLLGDFWGLAQPFDDLVVLEELIVQGVLDGLLRLSHEEIANILRDDFLHKLTNTLRVRMTIWK